MVKYKYCIILILICLIVYSSQDQPNNDRKTNDDTLQSIIVSRDALIKLENTLDRIIELRGMKMNYLSLEINYYHNMNIFQKIFHNFKETIMSIVKYLRNA